MAQNTQITTQLCKQSVWGGAMGIHSFVSVQLTSVHYLGVQIDYSHNCAKTYLRAELLLPVLRQRDQNATVIGLRARIRVTLDLLNTFVVFKMTLITIACMLCALPPSPPLLAPPPNTFPIPDSGLPLLLQYIPSTKYQVV